MSQSERPPSVDRLAREMAAASELPHAVCVELARQAIAAGPDGYAPLAANLRAQRFRHTLIGPVINATGVLLHTNLGRAPFAVATPAQAMNVEFDLTSGDRGSRQASVGSLFAMLCGAEAAMVVNNNAAAVLLVLAALAAERDVLVSRGESVEIGGGFRVPDVMEQSGAQLVDVGTTNRTRLSDYSKAMNRKHADVAIVLKVHPSNYRIDGFVESTSVSQLATLGVPVIADIGSGLIDANCPWLAGPPPAWLAGEPAARQTLAEGAALVTFSGDKLLGGPQAGIIAGRADLVQACQRHALARALRPGGHVLIALQELALAYLDRTVVDALPFWRMATTTINELTVRAHEVVAAAGVGEVVPTEATPGAGSAPNAGIASVGIRVGGDHLEVLRSAQPPIVARNHDGATVLDLRSVSPSDDSHLLEALPRIRVVATAGHVDHGKSSLVQALTGVNPDRFEEERRRGLTIDLGFAHTALANGVEISFIDVPGHVRFLRNMLAGVGGVDACMFVIAATEGWKPQSEEHLRILQMVGLRHGLVALTKVDLVDDEFRELQTLDVREHLAGTFLADAPIIGVSATTGAGLDELRAALAALTSTTPAAFDRGRPRLWIDRVFAAKGSGTVVTGTLIDGSIEVDDQLHAGGHAVRVRGIQCHGEARDSIAPGNRVALNLAGIDHAQLQRGDAVVRASQWRPTTRFDASLTVLPALTHAVSRRGAYFAYIGSGEFSVRVRVLGPESITAGHSGLVRLHVETAMPLPLLPGDRFVLRESGRDETVGGGEVLDVSPKLPASRATPNRDVDRVIHEHGWLTVDDLEALTGERRTATVGRWIVAADRLLATENDLRDRVASAGEWGLDIAVLDERERAALMTITQAIAIENGRARLAGTRDPLSDHKYVAALLAGMLAPPDPVGVDKAQLRELVRRGFVIERDGIYFHPDAIAAAGNTAAKLLQARPAGFTLGQFREALGNTRKHAVPLATELDARGVTRRRDDVRIAGPKMPTIK